MKLTNNFELKEFRCKDGSVIPDNILPNLVELAENLQVLRDYLDTPIKINSGYRSPAYNASVGGVKNSQHLLGKAADISCEKYTPAQLLAAVEKLIAEGKVKFGGVGIYNTFLHVDLRLNKARWDFRK